MLTKIFLFYLLSSPAPVLVLVSAVTAILVLIPSVSPFIPPPLPVLLDIPVKLQELLIVSLILLTLLPFAPPGQLPKSPLMLPILLYVVLDLTSV